MNPWRPPHSCNVDKLWCRRRPKCLYVWVNYTAYIETTLVESIFQEKLSDVPENLPIFRELLEVKSKVLRFRAQLRRTEEDRDILKKAARYFASQPE